MEINVIEMNDIFHSENIFKNYELLLFNSFTIIILQITINLSDDDSSSLLLSTLKAAYMVLEQSFTVSE